MNEVIINIEEYKKYIFIKNCLNDGWCLKKEGDKFILIISKKKYKKFENIEKIILRYLEIY